MAGDLGEGFHQFFLFSLLIFTQLENPKSQVINGSDR